MDERIVKGSIWISKQEKKRLATKEGKLMFSWLKPVQAAPYRLAAPLPEAFAEWADRELDFKMEHYPEGVRDEVNQALRMGAALAGMKGGQWFAFVWPSPFQGTEPSISAIPETEAAGMVQLPEDWESYVEVAQS